MITVLRLGHRAGRDARISTHVGLVARAFGADRIVYSGDSDQEVVASVNAMARWGGSFTARYEPGWKKFARDFEGLRVHLTAYGLPVQQKISEIREKSKGKNVLIIVGAEKVPPDVYDIAHYNVAVTSQPHSEVAALAVFLHVLHEGRKLGREFSGGRRIVPQERGKKVAD